MKVNTRRTACGDQRQHLHPPALFRINRQTTPELPMGESVFTKGFTPTPFKIRTQGYNNQYNRRGGYRPPLHARSRRRAASATLLPSGLHHALAPVQTQTLPRAFPVDPTPVRYTI